jgi:hypothetical protein
MSEKQKVDDITKAKQAKRQKTGWSMEEIKKQAAKDFKKYKEISKENPEPEGFVSGDMKNFLEENEDDDKEC